MSIQKLMLHTKLRKRYVLYALIALVIGVIFFVVLKKSGVLPKNGGKAHTITLDESGFHPAELTIQKGDAVTFQSKKPGYFWPASNLHPTHLLYPEFDPQEPIAAGDTWSFRFEKVGAWKYHDHLAPYFTGTITVIEGNISTKKESDCAHNQQTFACWQELLLAELDTKGLDATFDLLTKLYAENPTFPDACHTLTHNIGIAAYKYYLKDKNSVLTPKAAFCANGFYHGFEEALLTATKDPEKAREFCFYVEERLATKAPDAALQCFHGIGHGAMEYALAIGSPNAKDERVLINPALKMCETVSTTDQQLYRCASGVFNGIANFYITGEHGLKIRKDDPLWLCNEQPEKYKDSCYGNMNGTLAWLTNYNLEKAAIFIERIPENTLAESAIRYLSAQHALRIAIENPGSAIRACRSLQTRLHAPCIEGLAHGLLEHGKPGIEYAGALTLCRSKELTQQEHEICFHYVASTLRGWYPAEKSKEICSAIEVQYQQYCNNAS